jgi:hypothetical protein
MLTLSFSTLEMTSLESIDSVVLIFFIVVLGIHCSAYKISYNISNILYFFSNKVYYHFYYFHILYEFSSGQTQ